MPFLMRPGLSWIGSWEITKGGLENRLAGLDRIVGFSGERYIADFLASVKDFLGRQSAV
jgi:hypothetical protein